ncbi:TrmO family methyltransferase [Sphingomonas sp. RP10(2022)]|uniref:TrmO family methyltransferase n=1 Tax=Sphingomonas liriopis TaxID=2949094 RepID=A0A9X2HQZ0_9SPHN|nr:TrmO family methyltransferase [Sphingomonas liriopis]MCP3734867.1 TrmO family methyltransferase [Sphingomonas liriopis]
MTFTIAAMGYVRGGRADPIDDDWGSSRITIELKARDFGADALSGLDGFSHAEVIFMFDRVPEEAIEPGARHPRGRTDWPLTGIFAQRGKNRPNRLGVTGLQDIECRRAATARRGAGRDRWHLRDRHRAGDARIPASWRGSAATMDIRTDGRLLAMRFPFRDRFRRRPSKA